MPLHNQESVLVSIIVMTYNHGLYIEECLESLANQKCSFPFEILVGEDCSIDDTRQRVLNVSNKYPDIIRPILSESNLGACRNFENLLNLATGKYIALCEGDDYWQCPDKLQRQVDILEADDEVVLVCTDADVYFQNSGRRILSIHKRNGQWNFRPSDMTLALLTRKINIFTCSVCLHRNLLLRIFRENLYEFSEEHQMSDIQLWLEVSRIGRIVHIRESCATYRVITESASRSANYWKIIKFQEAALKISEHYVRKFGYDDVILHKVRMTQVWGMIGLVMKHRCDDLRQRTLELLQSRSMKASNILESIAFWSLGSPSRLYLCAPLAPLFLKLLIVPIKIRGLASIVLSAIRR